MEIIPKSRCDPVLSTQVKFVYDGDHILAEYDGSNTLLRKYIHGPCTDEPICLIEASGTYAGTHYYHYDALGSVVALTNSSGTVIQFYEYSVYGQVAASAADHPNRFMFTGREFDQDTGLYYYRARYYHPEIGRFLQTDPIGYGDGMNWYAYCKNSPIIFTDPIGLFELIIESGTVDDALAVAASMQRVRSSCLEAIKEIDLAISCMGCNQDHSPEGCPMIVDLQWLKGKLEGIVAGIESDEPMAIRMVRSDGNWAGAYLGAGKDCWRGDFEGEPTTTYPTIWYNESEGYDGDSNANKNWMWDGITLHELCHHYGVPDPVLEWPITNFYNPYAIMQLAYLVLWDTDAWQVLRKDYECVEKKECTCGPTSRNSLCPKHGRG